MDRTVRQLTVLVVAALAICSIPACVAVSDSYAMDDGSSAVSFRTSSPMSGEDALRLFDDARLNAFASDALYALFIDDHDLAIADISISNVSLERSVAGRLESNETVALSVDRYSMDISFRATATADRELLTLCDSDIERFLRHFDGNRLYAGDEIVIGAHITVGRAAMSERDYDRTSEGRFVNTYNLNVITQLFEAEGASFRLTHGDSVMNATIDSFREDNRKLHEEMDFPDGGSEAATASTSVLIDRWFRNSFVEEKFSFSGDVSGKYEDYWNNDEYNLMNHDAESYGFGPAVIVDELTYNGASLYGSAYSLFPDVRDPALASDEALRVFLDGKGTVSDSFMDAEDIFDSVSKTPARTSIRRMMVIGSIGILVSVAALGLIFYYARKR